MRRFYSLSIMLLSVLVLTPGESVAQRADDPFSDSAAISTKTKATPKREKIVVHLPTLDLCFRWQDMSIGLVQTQGRITAVKEEIKSLPVDPPTEKASKLKKQLESLTSTYDSTRRELDRIPYDTTFDLQRWEQFKEQLRHYALAEEERQAVDSHLRRENKRLRDENVKLRAEIERLKSSK